MKISINWIKEFVNLDGISNEKILERLMLSTAEIESVEYKGKQTYGIYLGRVMSVENHPNSTKLHILKIDLGTRGVYQCVCGAPNVRENMLVAFALDGACVNGFSITTTEKAGVVSKGMCCSEQELGIGSDSNGIMDIESNEPLGTDIKTIFNIDDTIFEVDNKSLTNRPDLWGHYGFARELSVIFDRELYELKVKDLDAYNNLPKIDVSVETDKCYRYSAIKVNNITKKVSPINMQIRLYYCGMRSLNLLADLTNYLMLEIGQPMHAFDGNCVNSIKVENAKEFDFITLDKNKRQLNNEDIMIKDKYGKNICIAGVMGGLDSEITDNSTRLLLESATFDATSIRKTASRLNLRSEASARYEKSLDPEMTTLAIKRFIYLLSQIDEYVRIDSSLTDKYNKKYDNITITTSVKYISDYIGTKISEDFIISKLTKLGFVVNKKMENLIIEVPSFRATKDVTLSCDIIEEVARIYGYDNIKATPLDYALIASNKDIQKDIEIDAKILLSKALNYDEINSYIFKDTKFEQQKNIKTPLGIRVLDNIADNGDEIRTRLSPTLMKVVENNYLSNENINIFEIARVVDGLKNNNCNEIKKLCMIKSSSIKSDELLYTDLIKDFNKLMKNLINQKPTYNINKCEENYIHPKNNANIYISNEFVGFVGIVNPFTSREIDPKLNIAVLEIDFGALVNLIKPQQKMEKTTKYQTVNLDFNFVCPKDIYYSEIENKLSKFVYNGLEYSFVLKDIYENDNLNGKSYTLNYELFSFDHTLTSEEISNFSKELIEYAQKFNYTLRV